MKRHFLLLFTLLASCVATFAQDNDSLARAAFRRADSAYAAHLYGTTLDALADAETYAGGANSRSLYLKVKALELLLPKDSTAAPMILIAGRRFLAVTDTDVYPAAKYYEIATAVATHRPLALYVMQQMAIDTALKVYNNEAEDYYMAVREDSKDGYKLFLDKYSFTPHYTNIRQRYDEKLADDRWYREHMDKEVRKKFRWDEAFRHYVGDQYGHE